MHNLKTVFNFEVIRSIKKKSFWILAIAFPVVISLVFLVIFFSTKATEQATEDLSKHQFSFYITDQSGLIDQAIVEQIGGKITTQKEATIDKVLNNKIDAYFFYPQDLTNQEIEIHAVNIGIFDNGRYAAVAKALLEQSVANQTEPQIIAILQDKLQIQATNYQDGLKYDGFKQAIAPGLFLILFYLLIAMFGNQMLTSTTEEKENRVTEMILTTINAKTLIIGKILSLIILGVIQIGLILIPIIVGYLLLRNQLALPNFNLSDIPIEPIPTLIGALIFSLSFLLFTGLLVAIGSIAPTAQQAGSFFGVVVVFIFGPLYAVTLFVSRPESLIVRFLTFFPLTAPIPMMLRNAVGNLATDEMIIGLIILAISAGLAMFMAIRLFRQGVLSYSSPLKLSHLFKKAKTK